MDLFPEQRLPAPALRADRRREEAGLCVLGLHSLKTTVMKQKGGKFDKFSDVKIVNVILRVYFLTHSFCNPLSICFESKLTVTVVILVLIQTGFG